MTLLAIDPGNIHSAYVLIDDDLRPVQFDKIHNSRMPTLIEDETYLGDVDQIVIEMIGHYGTGMPAGQTVFDTCVWIGRFWQVAETAAVKASLVQRREVKIHLCGSARAKDGNITQALVDRFAPGQPNRGKGTKREPGWFHGFSADIWQAYALAVYWHDTHSQDASYSSVYPPVTDGLPASIPTSNKASEVTS